MKKQLIGFINKKLLKEALIQSLVKMNPKYQVRNPVMFVVFIGSLLTTILYFDSLSGNYIDVSSSFILNITLWLWFTLLFANFAESIAEGRSKAQAQSLKGSKKEVLAKKLVDSNNISDVTLVSSASLLKHDIVLIEAGDVVPCDGEILQGCASVDESAITGESAPVIREHGGDFCSVTGGTKVLSDWIVVKSTANPGESFLDRMISMVEGARRKKTPNEIALGILLTGLTIVFLLVVVSLLPMSIYSVAATHSGRPITITICTALLVCLIPTTIGGLLSAIGVAGMGRMMLANVIATSGRAIEAAGDVDVLLLDKTGTITYGNRQANNFFPINGVTVAELAESSYYSSLADETPEGKSIVLLSKKYDFDKNKVNINDMEFIPFTANTRMSGVNFLDIQIRKGAFEEMVKLIEAAGKNIPEEAVKIVSTVATRGSTPLVVVKNHTVLGVVELKDIVKVGIKEKFLQLRQMGIKTIMITGDNKLTAAAIAAEVGVDDFLAEATPEKKLEIIRKFQKDGFLVAMTGDGTNDAPALAQADVAVAMNSGTQAAKEAANMVDLDSSPTKLIEIVEIGKQMLITRGALTTFSISNDLAKYFAIIPATFASIYPELESLNIMHLGTPSSAILSAVIFNALIIIVLIPLAIKGVKFKPMSASKLLRKNILIYGLGGIIVPFIGIKLIDIIINMIHVI
ncbi:MAG: potassium-transporting ATPase subunit KdpB [Burkholderiales bacterium]|nr:potassium-transporting ATPase subunit KdpB [Burkholderiales bacterium]